MPWAAVVPIAVSNNIDEESWPGWPLEGGQGSGRPEGWRGGLGLHVLAELSSTHSPSRAVR